MIFCWEFYDFRIVAYYEEAMIFLSSAETFNTESQIWDTKQGAVLAGQVFLTIHFNF
jgi:hypothetical protein